MADLSLRLLADAANAQGAFKDFGSAVTAAGTIVANFAKESIKAYADAERVQRQLRLAAGQATGALNEQAEAMKQKFAVDDDAIRHMDVLLLRYGAAPSAIGGATEAILNYAAATGKDATQAMEMLIRGVESGTGSLGRMGVHFKSTGNFAKDLAAAVEALNGKFSGAGEEDAKSMSGRMRQVGLAVDDLKKTFGSWFDKLDQRYGVLEKIAKTLRDINDEANRPHREMGKEEQVDNLLLGFKAPGQATGGAWQATTARQYGPLYDPKALMAGAAGNDHEVGKAAKDGKYKSALQLEADFQREHRAVIIANFEKELKDEQDHDDEILKAKRSLAQYELNAQEETIKKAEESSNEATKQMLKLMKEEQDDITKLTDVTVSRLKAQDQMWASAGMQVGSAFTNALSQAMANGGEDATNIALDLTESLLTIAGGVIGGIAGEGNPYATQAGSMLGNLAGKGIRYAVNSNRNKRHDGGWIERFHGGGWPMGGDEVPAVLQTGERVLSRREVGAMGGPAGVDAAARGGGQLHVHVSAMDTRSAREFFENDGGRGFYNALRTGRGSLTPLLASGR